MYDSCHLAEYNNQRKGW